MMGGKVAAEEMSDDEAGLEAIIAKKKKSATSGAKSRKIPFIQVSKTDSFTCRQPEHRSKKLTGPSAP